jgi:hypothetical protein
MAFVALIVLIKDMHISSGETCFVHGISNGVAHSPARV